MASDSNSPSTAESQLPVPPFQPSQNRPFRRRLLWIPILLLLLLLGGGFAWYFWRPVETPAAPDDLVDSAAPAPAGELPNFTTDASANLTAESQTKNVPDLAYKSENFRMADIAIGGEGMFLVSDEQPLPLALSLVRGEAFSEKDGSVKVVITWNTNKLAKSQVRYGKNRANLDKSLSESDYSFNHTVVLSDLDVASTYVYAITSEDRSGGQSTSDSYAVYTGTKSVSLFDLIADAIGQVFGWAIAKN